MKKYPFKFLDAYEREDRTIFFGRDEEISTLYEMIFQSDLVLVYGASGTGKTSLINCGLAGKFEPHNWFPLLIRRGKNINSSLRNKLLENGANFENSYSYSNNLEDFMGDNLQALSPIGKALQSIYQHYFRPLYLIFDQFEELFIIGRKQEQLEFLETLKDILQSGQPVKIILSIREEYLGHLFDFEREIPALLQKKLRVEPMDFEKVKQVIIGATSYKNTNVTVATDEAEALAIQIFKKLKDKERSRTIQLPFLQVFLDKFYLQITKDKTRKKDAVFSLQALADMGDIEDVLVDFLEEQVTTVAKEFKPQYPQVNKELIWKILSPFATLEGTKEPITKDELLTRLTDLKQNLIDELVLAFVNNRLLRFNENSETYEIAHDSLAKPIAEKRSVEENTLLEIRRLITGQVMVSEDAREYFTEKQLLFISPYLHQFQLNPDEENWIIKSKLERDQVKKKQAEAEAREIVKATRARNLKRKYYATGFLLIIFLGISTFAIFQTFKVKINKQELHIENEYIKELNTAVMSGRGEQYEGLTDLALRQKIQGELDADIESLIKIRASEILVDSSNNVKNFTLWIDVPSFKIYEIKKVDYYLCDEIIFAKRSSKEPSSAFATGFSYAAYCDTINVDIIKVNNDTLQIKFPFKQFFESKKDNL